MPPDQNQTTARGYYCHVCRDEKPKQEIARLRAENDRVRAANQLLKSERSRLLGALREIKMDVARRADEAVHG